MFWLAYSSRRPRKTWRKRNCAAAGRPSFLPPDLPNLVPEVAGLWGTAPIYRFCGEKTRKWFLKAGTRFASLRSRSNAIKKRSCPHGPQKLIIKIDRQIFFSIFMNYTIVIRNDGIRNPYQDPSKADPYEGICGKGAEFTICS